MAIHAVHKLFIGPVVDCGQGHVITGLLCYSAR